ncbi:MAG TPA: hypothetical protein VK976_13985 [Verrucomicrobiae bacterium]|jgi:hypothetical protein|nr:hypothetical protein [Verrucomicrobiae bacterium]
MSKLGQTLRGYFWWTYPRGSVPYDIMVTLILAFIFITPIFVNFRDKPQEKPARQAEVVVQQVGDGFLYKVDAANVKNGSDAEIRESLLRVIEPISGSVTIDKYQEMRDGNHHLVAYEVWAHR